MIAPSRTVDRLAVAVVVAATLGWLVLTLVAHRTPLYGVETDLLGDSFPATRALLAGHLEADRFQFRGPGYPLLLAGASRVAGGDLFLAARLLNVVAAGAAALAAFLLIRNVLGGLVGLGVVLALVANPVFLQTTIEAGSDMPALALALGASWLALRRGGWHSWAAAGLLAGGAFLTRYNTGFLFPAAAIALLADRSGARVRGALAYAAGVALVVAPWMAFLAATTGHPMQNQNYVNVAYEVYGQGRGWDHFWVQTGNVFHSFLDVARYDPAVFALHVGRNLATRWVEDAHRLMPVWLGALAVPGLIVCLWRRPGGQGMVVHLGLCYLVLTLVFYTPRFFLYLLPFDLAGAVGLLLWSHLAPTARPRPAGRASRAARPAGRASPAAPSARMPWLASAGPIAAFVLIVASAVQTVADTRRLLASPPEETRLGGMVLRRIGRPDQRVMARKPHVAYFAGMEYVPLPFQDTFTDFLTAVGQSKADYLFISGIEATLDPQLGVLADSGVALPALRPIAHGAVDSTRFFSLYQVVPTVTTVAEVEESLLVAIRRFAARRPGQAWPQTYLGGHLVTMGRYREALAPLDLSERLDPKDTRVARFQAIAHAELEEYEPAAAACERATRLGGAGDWEMAYLGHIRLMQGRTAEARDLLRQGVTAAPTNVEYLSEYVQACARSGAWAEAAPASEQLLRIVPGNATARLIGARAWLRTGHPERARSLAEMGGAVTGPDSSRWAALADSLRRGLTASAR